MLRPTQFDQFFCKSAERGELTWWARPTAEGRRPREKGNSHRGLAFPGSGGTLEERRSHYKAKGRRTAIVPRPFLLPKASPRAEGEDQQ
jgi:hypothetical protein